MSRRARALVAFTALLPLPLLHAGAHAQTVQIRVVDEPTRLGIAHAVLELLHEGQPVSSATTDTLGFARLEPPQRSSYSVRVSALGYVEQTREIDFSAAPDNIPAFVMTPSVLTLSPVEVEARRKGYRPGTGFVRPSQIISGARLVELRSRGFMLEHVIRQISGLRVRFDRGRLCVESTRQVPSFNRPTTACRMVTVVVNDFPYFNAAEFLAHATLDNLESVHYLSPTDASFRYGMAAAQTGALVLWTRGRGPYVTQDAWIPIKRDR